MNFKERVMMYLGINEGNEDPNYDMQDRNKRTSKPLKDKIDNKQRKGQFQSSSIKHGEDYYADEREGGYDEHDPDYSEYNYYEKPKSKDERDSDNKDKRLIARNKYTHRKMEQNKSRISDKGKTSEVFASFVNKFKAGDTFEYHSEDYKGKAKVTKIVRTKDGYFISCIDLGNNNEFTLKEKGISSMDLAFLKTAKKIK